MQLDGTDRTLLVPLVRYLQDRERWEDALVASRAGRTAFPNDFNLDLLHVRSLVQLQRPVEAIDVLNATHVLPSENARTSHQLYEQAHTLAALDAMEAGAYDEARRPLRAALEWPEHLGQGRPYDPEERLVRYVLGHVEQQLGAHDRGRAALEAVVRATGRVTSDADRLDLLVIPTLAALGRTDTLRVIWTDMDSDTGQLAGEMIRAMERGETVHDAVRRPAAEHPALFDDLTGRMLLRALAVTATE